MSYHRGIVHVAVYRGVLYADCHYCNDNASFSLGYPWSEYRIMRATAWAIAHARTHQPGGEPT